MRQNLWPNALAKLCGAALGAGGDKEARRAGEKSHRTKPGGIFHGSNQLLHRAGRPYRPPLRQAAGLVRRAGCPHPAYAGCRNRGACGHRDPAMAACGHAALRGPAGVWRESGAFRAADSRPYAMPSAWSVGRGAHTPPMQAAGTTGPAVGIAGQFGRIYNPPLQAYPLPFSVVGAACMAARTAPAGPQRACCIVQHARGCYWTQ